MLYMNIRTIVISDLFIWCLQEDKQRRKEYVLKTFYAAILLQKFSFYGFRITFSWKL